MKPWARTRPDFLADRAVEHLCARAPLLRNRKGMVGTCVSAQMLFMGAMFTRVMARAPDLVCLMVSFVAQRCCCNTYGCCACRWSGPSGARPTNLTALTVGSRPRDVRRAEFRGLRANGEQGRQADWGCGAGVLEFHRSSPWVGGG